MIIFFNNYFIQLKSVIVTNTTTTSAFCTIKYILFTVLFSIVKGKDIIPLYTVVRVYKNLEHARCILKGKQQFHSSPNQLNSNPQRGNTHFFYP